MCFGVLINLASNNSVKPYNYCIFQPRNGRTIESSGKLTFKSDKNFSITMILVKKGVTEKYYKPGTNLDTHVDVSYGHQEPYEQKRLFFSC